MRFNYLEPTFENLLEMLKNDTISRNEDVFMFSDILNEIEGNCSISLDGQWGSGKTIFVKQVKMYLDSQNEAVNNISENDKKIILNMRCKKEEVSTHPQVSVYYDAWENDNDEDPILSLIYSIMKNVDSSYQFRHEGDVFEKAASILELFVGRNFKGVVENFREKSAIDSIRKGKEIEEQIKEFLDSLLLEKGNRLVIFIDELDRCKPSFAVKLLERIKHYFVNDRITFVFSINISELHHTIRKFYGEGFDSTRYLDRFFDLRISLPPADITKYYQYLDFNNSQYTYDVVCNTVIKMYNFSLREITKYIRLTKIAAYEPTHVNFSFSFSDGKCLEFCLIYIVPVIIGLNVYSIDMYKSFVEGRNSKPLLDVIQKLKHHRYNSLLQNDESYDEEPNKIIVKLEDKIQQVYEALFVTEYVENHYETRIGEYTFDKDTRMTVMRVVSLLSSYSKINI